MHSRIITTLLLVMAASEVTLTDSLDSLAVFKDRTSQHDSFQILDEEIRWDHNNDVMPRNVWGVEEGEVASKGRNTNDNDVPPSIFLGGLTDHNNDNVTISFGLNNMMDMGALLTGLLVVALIVTVLGVGLGTIGGVIPASYYYDKKDKNRTSFPPTLHCLTTATTTPMRTRTPPSGDWRRRSRSMSMTMSERQSVT
ncbi:uncharacterized protein LOC123505829 [Portunus trituberculatus]|uniref:uncharacterized protein LOC123505829 n=1 Tax=Portunus trituberculatus TaxID=210409 RepID=UPI001E1CBBDB|nr:uncharacterized protein LOC123505829 [Portunus trituberculatus]